MNITLAQAALVTVLGLLGIGLYALLVARNLIKIIILLQILVKAVILAFVLAGHTSGQMGLGQSMATTIIVADTVVAVIGLALVIQIRRRLGTLDVKQIAQLRG
jgi:NADH:ubiquinone oxidoreductase subunit K